MKIDKIMMKKTLLAISLSIFVSQSHAGIRQYQADLGSSQWQLTNASRLECTLSHNIPNYGKAKFYSRANRNSNMEFELDMLRLPDNYSLAQVRAIAPNWKPGIAERTIADMKLHKQFSPDLPKKVAWTMLSELEQGMNPTFYYDDWYNENDRIAVGLSTSRFNKAYQEFIGCVGNLLNYSFDDIAYTVLNFEFNSDQFTKASKRRIAMITEYLSLDTELELVLVDGFTDSYGGRATNQKTSEQRANKIRDYFVKNGIDPSRIEAKGYGEKRHIASNDTVLGRAKNRRVVIRMDKE
ncbi:smf-dependent flagellar motor protein MotY [Thalassotalea insulae]|uniref:Smf-dependent flagellar motor protein MotY n=2 Tax=Thalassotalea insulae TaxID=2056778 RepID=A0ABQ6GVY3_9GAMM|nr:smf-dependent flagellar motor protein MotY [Thalassotalea insulae]